MYLLGPNDRHNCVCAYIIQHLSIRCWRVVEFFSYELPDRTMVQSKLKNVCCCVNRSKLHSNETSEKKNVPRFHWIRSCVQFESLMIRKQREWEHYLLTVIFSHLSIYLENCCSVQYFCVKGWTNSSFRLHAIWRGNGFVYFSNVQKLDNK